MWFRKRARIVTHNGKFHADDVFSVAALELFYRNKVEVVRTRSEAEFAKASIVLDVGMSYDRKKFFDHHQPGGAGQRQNSVPYAAFGLIWKFIGETVCESKSVAERLDEKIVQIIDADDNGKKIFYSVLQPEARVYGLPELIDSFNPLASSAPTSCDYDRAFRRAVDVAKTLLKNEIKKVQDTLRGQEKALEDYRRAADKRIVVQSSRYSFGNAFDNKSEVLYVVGQRGDTEWSVAALRIDKTGYAPRKPFPEAWAGKRGDTLEKITGVPGAVFCHSGRFVVYAKTEEAAVALAKLALQ